MKAKAKSNSSRTKQEIFDELVEESDENPLFIANFLRFLPSKAVKDKYRIFQIAALLLALTFVIIQVLHYQAGQYQHVTNSWIAIQSAIALFVIIGIASFGVRVFLAVAIVASIHVFVLITNIGFDHLTPLDVADIAVCILLAAVGIFLRIKLESKFKEELVEQVEEDGTIKKVSKIIFDENKLEKRDILD